MDGYMAEVNFIDGTALDASSFGETNDGIWVPKDTSGLTFGTNGFRLQFNQTGLGTASASTIGADISGNANHFTSTNIIASDCNMPDCPENNFAVMNQLTIGDGRVHSGAVYHEGNLKVACGGFSTSTIGGGFSSISIPKDKKIYCEVYEPNQDANLWGAGVIIDNHVQNSTQLSGNGGITYYNRSVFINGTENDYGSSAGLGGLGVLKLAAGDVLELRIPSSKPYKQGTPTKDHLERFLSGRYIAESVRHKVTPRLQNYVTVIDCVKDSIRNPMPKSDFTYPEEPKKQISAIQSEVQSNIGSVSVPSKPKLPFNPSF